ncbi:MAG: RluA family pseudouridine synthase, partial [Myxococcaceae bacterium]|nr:RluA family pseudouridine synthase [Myxococcaceae bacterium]
AVRRFTARVVAARASSDWAQARALKAALDALHAAAEAAIDARHAANRAARQVERERLRQVEAGPAATRSADLAARADEVEHRAFKARLRAERAALDAELARFEARLRRIEQLRVAASRIMSRQLYDTYVFENALGERRTLRELFAPREPPSGAGDCAAPKLIAYALRNELTPLALAEFWWGLPPRSGGKEEGAFYAPCAEKCGVVLPFLLAGRTPPVTRAP